MTELKSLKNPTRALTLVMFIAMFIYSIGAEGLAELLPGVPFVVITGIVSVATYAITQYGTEKRIVRAEELKDQEYENIIEDEMIVDGV